MLADGKFYGACLTIVQRALKRRGYKKIVAKGYFGSHTRDAIKDIQRRAGLAQTGNIGRKVWTILDGVYLNDTDSRAINKYVAAKRAAEERAAAAKARANVVGRIINAGMIMIAHRDVIHYTQSGWRMQGVRGRIHLPSYPTWEDCSSAVTWLYWQAGAPDPNGLSYNGQGFTGTLAAHGWHVSVSDAMPGDLVFYGWAPTFSHVGCVMAGHGYSARIFSHGSERGPLYVSIGYRSIGSVRRYDLVK